MTFKYVFLLTDILIYLLFFVAVSFALYSARFEHLRAPWRQVAHNRLAMTAAFVLSGYLIIALCDSIHFQQQAMNDIQLALYQIAVEQNFDHVNDISLTWHFLRMGSEVTILHSRDQLEKLRGKLIRMVDKIIDCMDDENNFLPRETILCNWCYLWEECTAKVGPNPVKRAD